MTEDFGHGPPGTVVGLDEPISVLRQQLARISPRDPSYADLQADLAQALADRYQAEGRPEDLDEAIVAGRTGLAATSADASRFPASAHQLAAYLRLEFERTGEAYRLDEAINLERQALAASPVDEAERRLYLAGLSVMLRTRYRRQGTQADLDECVEAGREALAATPPGDPARPQIVASLAEGLLARAESRNAESAPVDADAALTVLHDAPESGAQGLLALTLRAVGDRLLGKSEEAEALLRRVLEEDPGNRRATEELARIPGHATDVTESQAGGETPTVSAMSDQSATSGVDSPAQRPEVATATAWQSDAPATVSQDRLNRVVLARLVAGHLRTIHQNDPANSFLLHLDGSWGSGKSTLLNFIEEEIREDFLVVRLDAWQQSGIGPPWWVLLTAARNAIAGARRWWGRRALRFTETSARIRQAGATFLLALIILAVVLIVIAYALWPSKPTTASWAVVAQSVTTVAAAVALFWSGARVAARFLLWNSPGGARLFEQSSNSPMPQVKRQFSWLTGQSSRPVVFFIDNLDRCEASYVIGMLDAIQTLIRENSTDRASDNSQASARAKAGAAAFVVAADGAWLRTSYEHAYEDFKATLAQPGRCLGYLFLDKIFQLTVSMPTVSAQTRQALLENLLLGQDSSDGHIDQAAAERILAPAKGDAEQIRRVVRSQGTAAQPEILRAAAAALAAQETVRHTEHRLQKFAGLLDGNPRTIKRFVNTFSVSYGIRVLEPDGPDVNFDSMALWAIIRVRWPEIADYLQAEPSAVDQLIDPARSAPAFPADLNSALKLPDLRRVVMHDQGGPLNADLIRRCNGQSQS